MVDIYNQNSKRTTHFSPYSGGGTNAGHDGSITVSGVKGVYLEIIPRPEDYFEPIGSRPKIKSSDPYKRQCDFGNKYLAVN